MAGQRRQIQTSPLTRLDHQIDPPAGGAGIEAPDLENGRRRLCAFRQDLEATVGHRVERHVR